MTKHPAFFLKQGRKVTLVAITPRSFCNGPYFKAFRENIFSKSSLTEIHLFNSRNSIFNYDKVLQENIIFKLIKSIKRDLIKVKFSDDITCTEKIKSKFFDYKSIINYNDPNLFIHIPSSDQFNKIVYTMSQLKYFLSDVGIEVSTGKIVDFRNKEYLKENSQINTVPLIYPFNFKNGNIEWPIINSRKPNYIEYQDHISNLFLISDFYVLCKRFSSKEEKKRIVAVLYNPEKNNFKKIGFENHINYFHANGKGLSKHLAIGLILYRTFE